jgi:hypothetical protein
LPRPQSLPARMPGPRRCRRSGRAARPLRNEYSARRRTADSNYCQKRRVGVRRVLCLIYAMARRWRTATERLTIAGSPASRSASGSGTRYPVIVLPSSRNTWRAAGRHGQARIRTYVPDCGRMAVPLNLPLTCTTVPGSIFENISLNCGAPLRNRTVDLLLTMDSASGPHRSGCTDGTPDCTGSTHCTQ